MKKLLTVFACLTVLAMLFTACAPADQNSHSLPQGGVLYLSVNPEIAISYDADGNVTKVEARNPDALAILETYTGFQGKSCKTVVAELVNEIGKAGYFVDEIDGERRKITIEIEAGSRVPNGTFLDDVAAEVRNTVDNEKWAAPVQVQDAPPQKVACTNPYCKDVDCDDVICDAGICTNPYCNDIDCDDADCDDNIPPATTVAPTAPTPAATPPATPAATTPVTSPKRVCTNPYCKDYDCDDRVCDAGVCTNPYCNEWDCDDADCDDNIPDRHQGNRRTCTNPYCKDSDCDDRVCDAGVCTNPYCNEWDCDDADCDDDDRYDDDWDD